MHKQATLVPKLWTVLREGYTSRLFLKDLGAGVVVGIVALPLAIAFAIASGAKPEQGLYTAVVAGFLISALSGSRHQIGGPTGAFVVLVSAVIAEHGYEGLAVATLMAGIMLVIMGLAGFGVIIQYIPYPVTIGFTSGIALIILSGQVRDFLGLSMDSVPPEFIPKCIDLARHVGTVNPYAVGIGVATVAMIVIQARTGRRLPGSLIALVLTTGAARLFDLPVETIGSRFGAVPSGFPAPHLPWIGWDKLGSLVSPAFAIALLAGIESLLSAVVADGMTGRRHRSNMELVGQGVANILSPVFGGIPATGAIARTATNIRNGAQTPFAGIIHAAILLLILLFLGSWARLIPLATLAGILVVVAWKMGEWHLFLKFLKGPKSDMAVLLLTFLLTVLIDLTVAIQVGVVLAALLFMRRMADVSRAERITGDLVTEWEEETEDSAAMQRDIPEDTVVFEITGPFFFGAADKFKTALEQVERPPRVLILRMRHVPVMDATGLRALEDIADRARSRGTRVILSGLRPQPKQVVEKGGLPARLGADGLADNLDCALRLAREA